jgi:acetamidase/formamidase
MSKMVEWLISQVKNAKSAWLVVVLVAGMLGYKVTATPLENTDLSSRIANIEKTLKELDVKFPILPVAGTVNTVKQEDKVVPVVPVVPEGPKAYVLPDKK